MSSKFDERENLGTIRKYGDLIVELSGIVPDGIVCYFESYNHMEMMMI